MTNRVRVARTAGGVFNLSAAWLALLSLPAWADEPVPPPDPAPAGPSGAPVLVPLAQLMDERAGEAFVGKEISIEGTFYGMVPIDAANDPLAIPHKYRKSYVRFRISGSAGSLDDDLVLPSDLAGPVFSLKMGAPVRVTGTLEHIVSPLMVQPTPYNRLLVVTRVDPL